MSEAPGAGLGARSMIGSRRAVWLILRVRFLRLVNQAGAGFRRGKATGPSAPRTATAAKSRPGWAVGVLVGAVLVISAASFSNDIIDGMVRRFGPHGADRISVALGLFGHPPLLSYTIFKIAFLTLTCLLLTLASKELAAPAWDLEWLVTLPVRLDTLLMLRLVERSIINPVGLMVLWPFVSVLAWQAGRGYAAPVLGLGCAVLLQAPLAAVQTVADTALKMRWRPSTLRNLRALLAIASMASFYGAISPALMPTWATALPSWTTWTPPGLAVRVLTAPPQLACWAFALLSIEGVAVLLLSRAWVARRLRFGVMAAGVRESAGVRPGASPARPSQVQPSQIVGTASPPLLARLLSPVQRRELRLLARDRNFLAQTLLMPVLVAGAQLIFSGAGKGGALGTASASALAALAFAVAAYALMFSAFQAINAEGSALWLLYTLPRPLAGVLRDKTILWGALAALYPPAIFTASVVAGRQVTVELVGLFLMALLGVPVFAVIASALGVFACNPLAADLQRKVKIGHAYLYMLLGLAYGFGIYTSSVWARLALTVLVVLLALALWQKARDHLPFLLDPTASPPAAVSLSDGLIAAVSFFVFQLAGLLMAKQLALPAGTGQLLSFVGAGALTFTGARLVFWRRGAVGVPRLVGPGMGPAIGWGLAGGALAALGGAAYQVVLHRTDWLERFFASGPQHQAAVEPMVLPLVVLAAPLFEEFIFRGLVYGGLRRTVQPAVAALASAAIFAIVHPPLSVPSVFWLGLCAAFAFQRGGLLVSPIIAHAMYNVAVLMVQRILAP